MDAHGCDTTNSFVVIDPNPPAHAATTTVLGPPCAGCHDGTVFFNFSGGTPPYKIAWVPNVGAFWADSLFGLAVAVYHITVHDSCGRTFSIIVTLVVTPVEIHELSSNFDFSIIPNPAHNSVTISFPQLQKRAEIKIFDLFSHEILSSTAVDCRLLTFDCRLAPGMYLVQIRNESGCTFTKLIIE